MSFPKYPEYKPSALDSKSSLPASWSEAPLKRTFELVGGSTPKTDNEDFWDGELTWVTPADLSGLETVEVNKSKRTITPAGLLSCGTTLVPKGSIVISTRAPIGTLAISGTDLCTNQGCKSLIPADRCLSRFAYYYLSASTEQLNARGKGTTFVELSGDELGRFPIPVPSAAEQELICNFLDRETRKIDALIGEQQRLIELLQEKRQAVISNAVTKGLNPNAPMKDSGVEWLGEVPEHWEVGPIKRFLGSMNYKRVPLSAEERSSRQGSYPYYGASGIIDTVDDFLFNESLVLVSEDGANLLMRSTPIAFEAHGEYWVNNHAHILRPKDGLTLFWSERIESLQIAPFITGSAQPKLTADALLNLTVSCPLEEQEKKAIEARIKAARLELEPLIEAAEDTVSLLGERRSALISAAVTGQIDVRGLVTEAVGQ